MVCVALLLVLTWQTFNILQCIVPTVQKWQKLYNMREAGHYRIKFQVQIIRPEKLNRFTDCQ